MPDHPTVAPVRILANFRLDSIDAALTPPESSKMDATIACIVSLAEKRSRTISKAPPRVEKNTTYAQMRSVLTVAFLTAEESISALKCGKIWGAESGMLLSLFLRFCTTYSKNPLKIAEKTVQAYKNIPKLRFCHKVPPTVLMRKAEDGMEEHANTRSHSFFSILPFS